MNSDLLAYIAKFTSLSKEEVEAIAARILVHTFPKGALLLREGEIATKCYFVLRGCIRQYYLLDGEEKTTAFFTEEQAVVSFASYAQQMPSSHYLSCVEESTVMVGDAGNEQAMYQMFPKIETIARVMVEQDFGKSQEEFAAFMMSSPEERYRNLLQTRPELLQRVPQHQIASYLGITPESLSRIRKRLALKK